MPRPGLLLGETFRQAAGFFTWATPFLESLRPLTSTARTTEAQAMDRYSKANLVNIVLERAASKVGDITPLVLEKFYARFPAARQAFATLWPGQQSVLEGDMIDRSIYCLLQWYESPGEIEIMLMGSVPHHAGTLQVEPAWYGGLLQETMDVIARTIPAECVDQTLVWNELRDDLLGLVNESAQHG